MKEMDQEQNLEELHILLENCLTNILSVFI
jgi:hypothetical protein